METSIRANQIAHPVANWEDAKSILCIRLDSIGDVLMTTPAIRALKESSAGRKITLLTSSSAAKIAPLIPEVDDVISYDPPWMKATDLRITNGTDIQLINQLAWGGFDAAVIFTVFSQNPLPAALLVYLAGIPAVLAHCRENPYQLLTNWVPETDDEANPSSIRHEVRRQLDLVATVGCSTQDEHLSLELPPEVTRKINKVLVQIGIDPDLPWALIHPGASAPSRRYPAEKFAQAAQMLTEEHAFQVLFSGSKAEVDLVEQIRSWIPAPTFSLAGILNLVELSALISVAPLLISNNSGPVHIAAAAGTPVVDLYALTNPQHTPWMVSNKVLYHDVPCKFCYKSICPVDHHGCLSWVQPEQVVTACLDLLQECKDFTLNQNKKENQLCIPSA